MRIGRGRERRSQGVAIVSGEVHRGLLRKQFVAAFALQSQSLSGISMSDESSVDFGGRPPSFDQTVTAYVGDWLAAHSVRRELGLMPPCDRLERERSPKQSCP